jgi:hypothetical protein
MINSTYYGSSGQKTSEKILTALIERFPDSNPAIIELTSESFKYQLEKNDNYSYFLVEYSIDPSGNLKINWKSAEPFMM